MIFQYNGVVVYPSYEYVKAGGADHIRNVDSGVEIGAQGPSANPVSIPGLGSIPMQTDRRQ